MCVLMQLFSGHIHAGRHLGTDAEMAAWKGRSTEPLALG
jgi:hypothetical protein